MRLRVAGRSELQAIRPARQAGGAQVEDVTTGCTQRAVEAEVVAQGMARPEFTARQ